MPRWDLTGLFWDDYVEPKAPAEKILRTPPDPVWLAPDYLPHWDQAKDYQLPEMTDAEVMALAGRKVPWDSEFYANYALFGVMDPDSGKVSSFENDENSFGVWTAPLEKLEWIVRNTIPIGFYDTNFDVPMLHACLAGFGPAELMACVDHLIFGLDGVGTKPKQFYKDKGITPFDVNHIDLIALTPLGPSLKVCAGRLHSPRMADLPFKPGTTLSSNQVQVLRWYWYNDLQNTKLLWDVHKPAIELREEISKEYDVDVRSKSDPQIAEQVIRTEILRMSGKRYIPRAVIVPWRTFYYQPPEYLQFQSETMRWVLEFVRRQVIVVDNHGSPMMPDELEKMTVPIGDMVYKIGIGGLHSQEKRVTHVAGDDYEISDNDVISYYPNMILKQGMYPPNVGPDFLTVFQRIVTRRMEAKAGIKPAKKAGDHALAKKLTGTAETLKIVANGTFGKMGERNGFSVVYYPEMMIQTTVGGQLSLLMLIERLELSGISVISANTDGIIVKCKLQMREQRDAIMRQWEEDTGLQLEAKIYKAVYSRDVNNYVAILTEPEPGDDSAFRHAKAVGAYRKTIGVYPLKWNSTCEICNEALIEFLATGRNMEETIRACTDPRKFIEMRRVAQGACKDGEYLGKAIRWYYSTDSQGEIINAGNGHVVSRSLGGRPCMDLPTEIPADLDYNYYIERALALLNDFQPKRPKSASTPIAIAAE